MPPDGPRITAAIDGRLKPTAPSRATRSWRTAKSRPLQVALRDPDGRLKPTAPSRATRSWRTAKSRSRGNL